MRCRSPRTVGFQPDGKTISWSQKTYSKEYATWELPCGKCLECRLEYARSWAIRCVHESKMHEDNCFITLTYDDDHLGDARLNYRDFQLFMKRLRFAFPNQQIGVFVTGEYGEITKRPHWHACIFNWAPKDAEYKYTSDRGDKVSSSEVLTKLWGKGIAEFGSLTYESAGYCARYAAKKLVHGDDGHEFEPISKKSSKHAIGKRWLEKYWPNIFNYGELILDGRPVGAIPRYYEKWLQKHQPAAWEKYVTETKQKKMDRARDRARDEKDLEIRANALRKSRNPFAAHQRTRTEARVAILDQKFKQLQEKLKL